MNMLPRSITLILGSVLLLVPAHQPTLADQVHVPIVSAGGGMTRNNTSLSFGQPAIGRAKSRTHGMSAGGIPALVHLSSQLSLGDIDGDGDVDLDDHLLFAACMAGPDNSVPPRACPLDYFLRADAQRDNDVDLADFRGVAAAFTSTTRVGP